MNEDAASVLWQGGYTSLPEGGKAAWGMQRRS